MMKLLSLGLFLLVCTTGCCGKCSSCHRCPADDYQWESSCQCEEGICQTG